MQFRATIEALREFLVVIAPSVLDMDNPEIRLRASVEKTSLSDDEKDALVQFMLREKAESALENTTPSAEVSPAPGARSSEAAGEREALSEAADVNHEESAETPTEGRDDDAADEDPIPPGLATLLRDHPGAVVAMIQGMIGTGIAPRQQIFNRSLLVAAIAAFESLLGGLVGEHYRLHPGAMGADEPEFSLADLVEMGDLETAREVAVSRRVDSFITRGLDDWSKWADRTIKFPLTKAAPDYHEYLQLVQTHDGWKIANAL